MKGEWEGRHVLHGDGYTRIMGRGEGGGAWAHVLAEMRRKTGSEDAKDGKRPILERVLLSSRSLSSRGCRPYAVQGVGGTVCDLYFVFCAWMRL